MGFSETDDLVAGEVPLPAVGGGSTTRGDHTALWVTVPSMSGIEGLFHLRCKSYAVERPVQTDDFEEQPLFCSVWRKLFRCHRPEIRRRTCVRQGLIQ